MLLLLAIAGPLVLRLRYGAEVIERDLLDRTIAVLNTISDRLGEFVDVDEALAEQVILSEIISAPSILELSVFDTSANGKLLVSSVVNPDYKLDSAMPLSLEPREIVGPNGVHVLIVGRTIPNHPELVAIAATSLQDLDRFSDINRRVALIFTFVSLVLAIVLLNFFYQRKIGRPIESILSAIANARAGDYSQKVAGVREDEIGQIAKSFNDLLERVKERTTEQLLETQKSLIHAERLAAAGQMAATFAHEIGSPLTSLSAHVELLREDQQTTPQQREELAFMLKQIQRLTQIVDEVLQSARRSPDDFVAVNVVEVLGDVLNLVGPRLKAQNITVATNLPATLQVRGYALYLQEVFLNLIDNAAEAMERSGRLDVAGGLDSNGRVWIEIRDTGPGIDPKIIDDVWKHFVTTKAIGKGTGLGLGVVRDIVRQHGGEVSLQSSTRGTCVRVVLPALQAQSQAREAQDREAAASRNLREAEARKR